MYNASRIITWSNWCGDVFVRGVHWRIWKINFGGNEQSVL